ncbi:MAG: protein translocase subunit SecD [Longimicrobiales bacterium]
MFKTTRGRLITIVIIVAVALGYLYTNGIKYGLDLQGGMHLVLEVDDPEGTYTDEAKADHIDRADRILRTRIDEFGVEEPLIQKVGTDRLIIELPGIRDEARAKELIQRNAYLEFRLVLPTTAVEAALPRVDRAILATLGEDSVRAMGQATETAPSSSLEELLFQGGDTTAAGDSTQGAEAGMQETGADTAQAEAPVAELRPFTGLLNQGDGEGIFFVAEEDLPAAEVFLSLPDVQRVLPRGTSVAWGADLLAIGARNYKRLYVLEEEPFMTGDMLENAVANRDTQYNQAIVNFELNRRGGRRFAEFTGQHVGDFLAIVLDGEVMSAPVIRDRIGASGQIELGNSPMEEARDLALVLRAGALTAPLTIMEERTVGPSLGQDSIDAGMIAGIVGLVLVVGVMIAYYRMAGLLAIGALAVYVILVLGGLAALNATLTVPGIAGLILSIGMAVDANVLIFERIREELIAGRATRTAVDEGFGNALSAIVDSNITTLLTALILFQFGTGPVRGFAVTLSIGIVASFFSAVFVTRTFFLLYLSGKKTADPISI